MKKVNRNSLRIVHSIKDKANKILRAITSADGSKIHKNLIGLNYEHRISPETLALCFKEDEVELTVNAWATFRRYLEENYRPAYPGNEIQILATEASYSIEAFEKLLLLLETQVR